MATLEIPRIYHATDRERAGNRARVARVRARTSKRAAFCARAICLCLIIWIFVGEASVVPTASMQNTVMVGDHLLWIKALHGPEIPFVHWRLPRLRHVRRGEIIAFRPPLDPAEVYLKRAIAIGGDRVAIENGVLWLNGEAVRESYAIHSGAPPETDPLEQMTPVTVPAGDIFVLGDNRDHSSDSREWGFVSEQNVLGSPLLVLWSYDAPSAQWLDASVPHELRFYGSIFTHLVTRTRWSRTFTLL